MLFRSDDFLRKMRNSAAPNACLMPIPSVPKVQVHFLLGQLLCTKQNPKIPFSPGKFAQRSVLGFAFLLSALVDPGH